MSNSNVYYVQNQKNWFGSKILGSGNYPTVSGKIPDPLRVKNISSNFSLSVLVTSIYILLIVYK